MYEYLRSCLGSTAVELLTHNPKVEGLNPREREREREREEREREREREIGKKVKKNIYCIGP
jgi:hypothetical protein